MEATRGFFQATKEEIRFQIRAIKVINASAEEKRCDFVVVGAGAAGPVLAGELSAWGAR
jgi:NADH dehydrogenase FAD-containing subunit